MTELSSSSSNQMTPVECVDQFFHGTNTPRVFNMDFSQDGLHGISAHMDDAVRWVDVVSLQHRETIRFPSIRLQRAVYTSSSDRIWIAPGHALDGHVYLYCVSGSSLAAAIDCTDADRASSSSVLSTSYSTSGGIQDVTRTPGLVGHLAQSPSSDLAAIVNTHFEKIQVLHPLVSRPVASTTAASLSSSSLPSQCNHVAWSGDGMLLAAAGQKQTVVFDLRKLSDGPVAVILNVSVFTKSASVGGSKGSNNLMSGTVCVGTAFCSTATINDALLMTSGLGEVVLVKICSPTTDLPSSSTTGRRGATVLAEYCHGAAARQLAAFKEEGSGSSAASSGHGSQFSDALPAQFVAAPTSSSSARRASFVVQAASSLSSGRQLMLYEPVEALTPLTSSSSSNSAQQQPRRSQLASLRYLVQCREHDPPRAMAINRRFGIVALGSQAITWWAVNATE